MAKNGQKTAKIDVLRAKKWFYVIDTFFGTFWQNLKKILGTIVSQSLKNPEMTSNIYFFEYFLSLGHYVPPLMVGGGAGGNNKNEKKCVFALKKIWEKKLNKIFVNIF